MRSTPAPVPTAMPPTPRPAVSILPHKTALAAEGLHGSPPLARRPAVAKFAAARSNASRPIWDAASAGKAVTATAGSGANAGPGAGAGAQGSGIGAASGTPPCGYVTFSDPHGSHYDSRTHGFWVDIRMAVHFADGSAQSMLLDYPWYYPSEAANPWSDRNLSDPTFPTRFQPPPAQKASEEPQLVKYVMQHSTSDGATLLDDCPGVPATPAAQRQRTLSGLTAIGHSP
ncbi:MAG: hypothetical protein WB609_06265 [Candidatus Cybelea sp.]